jgi:iron complex outermembrane recepter protein
MHSGSRSFSFSRQHRVLPPAAVASVVMSIFAVTPVLAQESGESLTLEEVIVTAQFREQSVQDTPLSITAVSAEMLEARNQVSIADVTNQAPNVVLKPAAGPFGPTLQAFIRGVGQYDFNYALEPGVGMYIDDVYFSTITGSNFDLLDLDRLEVLRGPQGTLAGQNSIGGAVKLYSKKPEGDDTGSVQVTYGSFHRTDVRASADVSLVEDKLFMRVAGVSRHVDGYVTRYDYGCTHPGSGVPATVISESCKLGTEGGKSYDAARVAFRYLPTDKLEINLSADYTNDNSEASPLTLIYVGRLAGPGIAPNAQTGSYNGLTTNNQASGIPMGTATGSVFIPYTPFSFYQAQDSFSRSPYINYSNYLNSNPVSGRLNDTTQSLNAFSVPAINQVDSYGIAGTVDFEINDNMNIKSITAYRYYSGAWSIDEDATPISTATLHNVVWHRQFSEELRWNAKWFDSLNTTLGGLYFEQKSHYGGRINLEPSRLDFLENDYIPGETKAVFANFDWAVTDQLSLIAGGRYTEQEKTFVFGRLPVPGALPSGTGFVGSTAVAPLNGLSKTYEGAEVDYRGAVQFKWTDDLMTYAQVATGFKGGGINPRPFFANQAQPFNSETLTAYEVGFKTDLFSNTVRVNGSVFFNDYEDIILTVNTCPPSHQTPGQGTNNGATPCAAPINAGMGELKGAELETEMQLFDGFSLDASASYLDFEYTELSSLAQAAGLTLAMTTPFAPKWKYSAGAQYQIALGDAGTLTPRLDWSYQAAFHSQPGNHAVNRVPNYYVLNGRLSWQSTDEKWNVAFEGSNLTNEVYYLTFFDNRTSTQNVFGQVAAPRQWAVTLKRSFQ